MAQSRSPWALGPHACPMSSDERQSWGTQCLGMRSGLTEGRKRGPRPEQWGHAWGHGEERQGCRRSRVCMGELRGTHKSRGQGTQPQDTLGLGAPQGKGPAPAAGLASPEPGSPSRAGQATQTNQPVPRSPLQPFDCKAKCPLGRPRSLFAVLVTGGTGPQI